MFDTDPAVDALVARFPRLFRGKRPQVASHVPDGWADLVSRLLADIDALLDDANARRFEVLQIKEKFAGLRVYWRLGRRRSTAMDIVQQGGVLQVQLSSRDKSAADQALAELIEARIQQAESEASSTCQDCGRGNAKASGTGWVRMQCADCARQRGAR